MRAPPVLCGISAFFCCMSAASAHNINDKEKIFFIDAPWVERAWAEGDFRLGIDLVDVPGPSSPTPQTGFVIKLPGIRLNLYNRLELGFDVPFVINPDAQQGLIPVADPDAAAAGAVASADFDIPTVDVYAKLSLVGDKKSPRQMAIGFEGKLGMGNNPQTKAFDAITLLRNPFMTQYETQLRPFVAAAFAKGAFAPSISVGVTLAQDADLPDGLLDENGNPVPGSDLWIDWGVAVPVYSAFTDVALVVGANGRHLLSGLSTALNDQINANAGVLFGGSGASEFGFIARIPVFSPDYRNFEDFSLRFIYSYNLSSLTLKKKKKDEEKKESESTSAPTSEPASAPVPEPTSEPTSMGGTALP